MTYKIKDNIRIEQRQVNFSLIIDSLPMEFIGYGTLQEVRPNNGEFIINGTIEVDTEKDFFGVYTNFNFATDIDGKSKILFNNIDEKEYYSNCTVNQYIQKGIVGSGMWHKL